MRSERSTWRKRDDGAVAVVVAILLVVFIGFAALVVDVGYWYNVRRQLQAAADSAALAGCAELKQVSSTEDETARVDAVFAVATEYALKNAVAPGDGLEVMPLGTSATSSEVGGDYVKITVRKAAPAFFSGIFGDTPGFIMAQAKAQLQWVQGMPGLAPLFVPIVGPEQVLVARVGTTGAWTDLTDPGDDGVWDGTVPVTGGRNDSGYELQVGIAPAPGQAPVFVYEDASRVVVRPEASPLQDVYLDPGWATSNVDGTAADPAQVRLVITATQEPNKAALGKQNAKSITEISPGVWAAVFDSSGSVAEYATWDATVQFGAQNTELKNVASLVVRRNTCPVADVIVSPSVLDAPGSVHVSVEMNDFRADDTSPYLLKVADGEGTLGSLMAVDLNSLKHPLDEAPEPIGGHGGKDYSVYLAYGYPDPIHVGDTVETLPGGKAGPTADALRIRIAGGVPYQEWKAGGRTITTPRILYVPIVEFSELQKERRTLTVVEFAAFYLERVTEETGKGGGKDTMVAGYFIDYVGPGTSWGTGEPPMFGIQAPRLVADGVNF